MEPTRQRIDELVARLDDEGVERTRSALRIGTRSRDLFEHLLEGVRDHRLHEHRAAVEAVYGVRQGETGYRRAYTAYMRLVDRLERLLAPPAATDAAPAPVIPAAVELYHRGRSLLRSGEYRQAERLLREGIGTIEEEGCDEIDRFRYLALWSQTIQMGIGRNAFDWSGMAHLRDLLARAIVLLYHRYSFFSCEWLRSTRDPALFDEEERHQRELAETSLLAPYADALAWTFGLNRHIYHTARLEFDAAAEAREEIGRHRAASEGLGLSFIAERGRAIGGELSSNYDRGMLALGRDDLEGAVSSLARVAAIARETGSTVCQYQALYLSVLMALLDHTRGRSEAATLREDALRSDDPYYLALADVFEARIELYTEEPDLDRIAARLLRLEELAAEDPVASLNILRLRAKMFHRAADAPGLEAVLARLRSRQFGALDISPVRRLVQLLLLDVEYVATGDERILKRGRRHWRELRELRPGERYAREYHLRWVERFAPAMAEEDSEASHR